METATEHIDVLIVGAGTSGIGFAYYLQKKCPNKTYEILEARDSVGGTWDLFRYPGIRSDSDVHCYAYSFKPWEHNKVLADGDQILDYLKETAAENGIDKHIKFRHEVKTAEWDSDKAQWRVEMTCTKPDGTQEERVVSCTWLQVCAGYYSYKEGHRPDFPNEDAFEGEMIHPQEWNRNYEARGKRFVVIGSGATAITLIPSLAQEAEHVTMVQRSPSYIAAVPAEDPVAKFLRKILPNKLAFKLTRKKSVWLEGFMFRRARTKPKEMTEFLMKQARKILPEGFDVEKHFLPNYKPWDQRMCMSPDGDLFHAIADGKASVETEHIETFTKNGLRLKSGKEIEADVIITATGLKLAMAGDVAFKVDDREIDFSNLWGYKNAMFSSVPNMSLCIGFLAATWTLRVELIADYVCRLLNYMDKHNMKKVVPALPVSANEMKQLSIFSSFTSGYIQRAEAIMPKQGDEDPWISHQTYKESKNVLEDKKIDDGILAFSA